MTAIRIEIPGSLLPWQRAARGRRGSYTSPEQAEQQQRLQWAWAHAVAAQHRGGQAKWSKADRYAVAMVVTWPDARRRDIDNAQKTVLDALTCLAWDDDDQVDAVLAVRSLPHPRGPVVRIVIARWAPIAWADVGMWWASLTARAFVARLADLLVGDRREAA